MGKVAKAPDPKKEAELAAKKIEKAENDLVKACKNDELSKAKKSVEAGAKLDIDASGVGAMSTPMHVAAGFGSYEVCKYIFEVGGMDTLEAQNTKKKTPLDVAEQVGEEKIVRLLKALLKEAELAAAMSRLSVVTFSMAGGKLGMGLDKNVVSKVGDESTQAGAQGVQAGWVLRTIGGVPAAEDTKAVMKQAATALKAAAEGESVEFAFEVSRA